MAQLVSIKGTVLLAVNRQVLVLDLHAGNCPQIINLPSVKTQSKSAGDGDDDNNQDEVNDEVTAAAETPADGDGVAVDPDTSNSKSATPVASNRILHTALSPNGELLAVATADEKSLHLYRLNDGTDLTYDEYAQLLSSRPLSRTSSAIRFSSDSRQLFVADKTGDCFVYACDSDDSRQTPGKCVMSHLSMVLDIMQTPCGRYVISCDRDEKIRCTQYPRTAVIESYCLGHTEYVSAIELLPTQPDELLVSVSGDKTMRLWNFLDGTESACFDMAAPMLHLAVRKVSETCTHAVVTLLQDLRGVVVYEIERVAEKFECRKLHEFFLEDVVHVQSITFDARGDILLAAITGSDETAVFRFVAASDSDANTPRYTVDTLDALNDDIASQAADLMVPFNHEELNLLFKKKFANIHDYHERKRRRIEEKNNRPAKKIAIDDGGVIGVSDDSQ